MKIQLFFLFSAFIFGFGQQNKIDSLETIYNNNTDIKNLYLLSKQIVNEKNLKKIDYIKLFVEKGKSQQDNFYKANACLHDSYLNFWDRNFKAANKNLDEGLIYANIIKDYKTIGRIYSQIGQIHLFNQDNNKSLEFYRKEIEAFNKCKNKDKECNLLFLQSKIDIINLLTVKSKFNEALLEVYYLKKNNLENVHLKKQTLLMEGNIYNELKNFKKANSIFEEILKLPYDEKDNKQVGIKIVVFYALSDNYISLKNIDKAKYYRDQMRIYEKKTDIIKDIAESYNKLLDARIAQYENNHELASKISDSAISSAKKDKDKYALGTAYLIKGISESKIDKTLNNLQNGYLQSKVNNNKIKQKESLEAIIKTKLQRDSLTKKDIQNLSSQFGEYILLNDDVYNERVIHSVYESDAKFRTAEKESQIKSQQLQLEKEKSNRNLAFGGVGILGMLSLVGFIYSRNRHQKRELENKNTLLSLQQNLNEMELQNLNKQLDPHEIKNFLATISPEIQVKAPEAYKRMIKLLNLTKASLNSGSITENILVQIAQIEDYLSLERQILTTPLEYQIINEVAQKNIQIPRLLLKNLVENSIKHGIKNRKEPGKIVVTISEVAGSYEILVDDNGSGRKDKVSKDSGIGISTYQKLFETLNEKNAQKASFNIHDKEQGTKVEVKIPKNYNYS